MQEKTEPLDKGFWVESYVPLKENLPDRIGVQVTGGSWADVHVHTEYLETEKRIIAGRKIKAYERDIWPLRRELRVPDIVYDDNGSLREEDTDPGIPEPLEGIFGSLGFLEFVPLTIEGSPKRDELKMQKARIFKRKPSQYFQYQGENALHIKRLGIEPAECRMLLQTPGIDEHVNPSSYVLKALLDKLKYVAKKERIGFLTIDKNCLYDFYLGGFNNGISTDNLLSIFNNQPERPVYYQENSFKKFCDSKGHDIEEIVLGSKDGVIIGCKKLDLNC